MKLGHDKRRIIVYTTVGSVVGLLAIWSHEALDSYDFKYHDWLISIVVIPLIILAMGLLAKRENTIYHRGKRMNDANRRVKELMQSAAEEKSWVPLKNHDYSANCWDELDCDYTECPAYGREQARCWLIAGTFCRGETQGQFAKKLEDCRLCEIFKKATSNPVKEITESFYIMNHLLGEREEQLERAVKEARARSEKLSGLVTLSEAAFSSVQLSDQLQDLLESSTSFAGADIGRLYLVDESGKNLNCWAEYGMKRKKDSKLVSRVGEDAIGRAFSGDYIFVSEDVLNDNARLCSDLKKAGARTMIGLPLHGNDAPLGMLVLCTSRPHHYSEEEKNSLCIAADRIAASVENSQLLKELKRDREQIKMLDYLSSDMESEDGFAGVYRSLISHIAGFIDFDRSSLAFWHSNEEEFEIMAVETKAKRTWLKQGLRLPKEASPIGKVIESGTPMLRGRISGDEYPVDKLLVEEGMRSAVIFPVKSKGRVTGTFNLCSLNENAYDEEDIKIIEPMIKQLGLMLDNVRIKQEASRMSIFDAETGLYNYRFIHEAAIREVSRAKRNNKPISMMLIDITPLHILQNSRPQDDSEDLVRDFAVKIKGFVRQMDVAGRYNGDTIAVLFPETGIKEGEKKARDIFLISERIRGLMNESFAAAGSDEVETQLAIGLAEFPMHADSSASLMEQAELALDESRDLGKSRLVVARRLTARKR